jgi:hypothetical protein
MAALFDVARQLVPWLTERGLKKNDILRGMNILLGEDWETIDSDELIKRFQKNGHKLTQSMPFMADEIEALIRGAIKLDDFRSRLTEYLEIHYR